jgi:uncharacterized protein (DUF952 family)
MDAPVAESMAEVWKILRTPELLAFVEAGVTAGAPVDRADGFIHFSTPEQAPETAARHFAGEDGLWLVACDAGRLGAALRWEPSRGGALFPHLYRPLVREDVAWIAPVARVAGAHVFPR